MIREWKSHKKFQNANFNLSHALVGKYQGHIDRRLFTNGKKKKRFIIRKVRPDGTIKWDHRLWKPMVDQEHLQKLIGHKLAFGTYSPEYSFLNLWGSEEAYYDNNPDNSDCWNNDIQLLTVPGYEYPSQRFFICVWWYPVTNGRDF